MTAKPFRGHSIQLTATPLLLNAEPFHCASVQFHAFPLLLITSPLRCCSGLISSIPSCAVAAPLVSSLFLRHSVQFHAFPLLLITSPLRCCSRRFCALSAMPLRFRSSLCHSFASLCFSVTTRVVGVHFPSVSNHGFAPPCHCVAPRVKTGLCPCLPGLFKSIAVPSISMIDPPFL